MTEPTPAEGLRCLVMRGGTSKGAYFLKSELPADAAERDELLVRAMGSPDPLQVDGIGGGHPLTSKVAVIAPSADDRADVDYHFIQVMVDRAEATDQQNCGNILAGVGPFAVERGLVQPGEGQTSVRIRLVQSDSVATATFATSHGKVNYGGRHSVGGGLSTGALIRLEFADTVGSTTGALLPTGNVTDSAAGLTVTCVDNGMPSVMVAAADLGVSGTEDPAALEANKELAAHIADVRAEAAELMGMGDVSDTTVPKVVLLSRPRDSGAIGTRSFLPVRCHTSIGVFGALTVAAGTKIPGSVGHRLADLSGSAEQMSIEHPTGHLDVSLEFTTAEGEFTISSSGVLRTARKVIDGVVYPRPSS